MGGDTGISSELVDICVNATYHDRIDDPGRYNWCIIEDTGPDVILFAGLAVLVATLLQGKFATLMQILIGGALMAIAWPANLAELSNAMAWWLGIHPYELFFMIFLPPLVLDAGVRIDFHVFKKVMMQVIILAFAVVVAGCLLLIPLLLYMFRLETRGFSWVEIALLGAMTASTDAVAILAIMKTSGGPHRLRTILEGESLLNDASSITLFKVFLTEALKRLDSDKDPNSILMAELLLTVLKTGAIGLAFGLAAGFLVRWTLRQVRRLGGGRDQQIALTLSAAYLCFYMTEKFGHGSGVVATAVLSLYGAATSRWDMSFTLEESGAFDAFWDTAACVVNALVFFFSGVSCLNFFIRAGRDLRDEGKLNELWMALWMLPCFWLLLNFTRLAMIVAAQPICRVFGQGTLTPSEVLFAAVAGLRGSISLIMGQAFVAEASNHSVNPGTTVRKAQIVFWNAGFVLLTLSINASVLPAVLKYTGLGTIKGRDLRRRQRAVTALVSHTASTIKELKEDEDEILTGVDWSKVDQFTNVTRDLHFFQTQTPPPPGDTWLGKLLRKLNRSKRRGSSRMDRSTSSEAHSWFAGLSRRTTDPGRQGDVSVGGALGRLSRYIYRTQSTGPLDNLATRSVNLGQDPDQPTAEDEELPFGNLAEAPENQQDENGLPRSGSIKRVSLTRGSARQASLQRTSGQPRAAAATFPHAGPAVTKSRFAMPRLGLENFRPRLKWRRRSSYSTQDGDAKTEANKVADAHVAAKGTGELQEITVNGHSPASNGAPAAAAQETTEELPSLARQAVRINKASAEVEQARKWSGKPSGSQSSLKGGASATQQSAGRPALGHRSPMGPRVSPSAPVVTPTVSAPHLPYPDAGGLQSVGSRGNGTIAEDAPATFGSGELHSPRPMRRNGSHSSLATHSTSIRASIGVRPNMTELGTRSSPLGPASPRATHDDSDGSVRKLQTLPSLTTTSIRQTIGVRPQAQDLSTSSVALPGVQSQGEDVAADSEELLEARSWLVAGMKRYLHGKRMEGLISARGLRVLGAACDEFLESPGKPLSIWKHVEEDVMGLQVKLIMAPLLLLRRIRYAVLRLPKLPRRVFGLMLQLPLGFLVSMLSKQMLLSCEVALEYSLSLTSSPHVAWLQEGTSWRQLSEEIAEENRAAWRFLIDREIEAPQRFSAIQSHRAAMAILRQQRSFVRELFESGMIDAQERDFMTEPVDTRERKLELLGPRWKAPSLRAVLAQVPFIADAPKHVRDILLSRGEQKSAHHGEQLVHNRAFLVVSGIVHVQYTPPGGVTQDIFLGIGGMHGMYSAITGVAMPGTLTVTAKGHAATGRGPQLFMIPTRTVDMISQMAAGGDPDFMWMQLAMMRGAAAAVARFLLPTMQVSLQTAALALRPDMKAFSDANAEPRLDEEMPPPPQARLTAYSFKSSQLAARKQQWARQKATDVTQLIEKGVATSGMLLQLSPGELLEQRCSLVLLKGTLGMLQADADSAMQNPATLAFASLTDAEAQHAQQACPALNPATLQQAQHNGVPARVSPPASPRRTASMTNGVVENPLLAVMNGATPFAAAPAEQTFPNPILTKVSSGSAAGTTLAPTASGEATAATQPPTPPPGMRPWLMFDPAAISGPPAVTSCSAPHVLPWVWDAIAVHEMAFLRNAAASGTAVVWRAGPLGALVMSVGIESHSMHGSRQSGSNSTA